MEVKKKKKKWSESHEGQKSITVWFEPEMVDRLDRLAKRGDIPRSRLVRNLVGIGVDYLETCEKFGVLQTALVLRDFGNWVKGSCEDGVMGDVEKA